MQIEDDFESRMEKAADGLPNEFRQILQSRFIDREKDAWVGRETEEIEAHGLEAREFAVADFVIRRLKRRPYVFRFAVTGFGIGPVEEMVETDAARHFGERQVGGGVLGRGTAIVDGGGAGAAQEKTEGAAAEREACDREKRLHRSGIEARS